MEKAKIEIVEELIRIEELCSMISFFFSKLYDIGTFREKTKYFTISKHVVFFALQRSLGRIEAIERKLDYLVYVHTINQNSVNRVVELKEMLHELEITYKKNKIKEVVNKIGEFNKEITKFKNEFI
jgi:uncharacterized coiled-coil DUF342 family protein